MSNQFEKQQVEEGIGPGNIGGMGPIQLPTDTEPGSGDVPSGRKSKEDEDDEKEKVKKMKDFIPTFEAFISEASMNDPVLMAFRAAKMKREKELAKPKRKPLYGKQREKAENSLWVISQDLKDLYADRGQLLIDMEQEAEIEGGPVADRYGEQLDMIEDKIASLISQRNKLEMKLAESLVLEMDSEGIQSLADELSAEVYTARLKAGVKSATIKATTTTKTWDDGAPVLKYLARGKAQSMAFTLYQRPFTVLHDVANGWFYFTDGRKWYGLHGDEGYFEPEDLPFDMEISEDVVTEGYGEFIKAKNLTDIVNLSKEKKRAVFYVTDDNNSRIGAFYLKNGKFAKATTANPSYDLQNNKTTLRDRSDVIYKYKIDESLVTEALSTAQKKRLSEYLDNLEFDDLWEISDFVGQQETEIGLEDLPEWKKLQNTKSITKLRQFAFDHMLKNNLTVKDLKEAGILESVITEARSISKIQKEWGNVTAMMKDTVSAWKKAEGQEKEDLLDQLKTLTISKKKLEAELDSAVGLKDIDAELE